eukprot:1218427-Prymnesium_polylepis.1
MAASQIATPASRRDEARSPFLSVANSSPFSLSSGSPFATIGPNSSTHVPPPPPVRPDPAAFLPAPEAPAGVELPPLRKGSACYYTGRQGERKLAKVAEVHFDEHPPYYTISIDGVERSTVRERLTPAPESATAATASRVAKSGFLSFALPVLLAVVVALLACGGVLSGPPPPPPPPLQCRWAWDRGCVPTNAAMDTSSAICRLRLPPRPRPCQAVPL